MELVKVLEQQRQQLLELLLEGKEEVFDLPNKSHQLNGLNEEISLKFTEKISQEISSSNIILKVDIRQQLKAAKSDHSTILTNYVQAQVAKILGRPQTQLQVTRSLIELGLESLSAMELKEKFKRELDAEAAVQQLPPPPICGTTSLTPISTEFTELRAQLSSDRAC